VAFGPQPRSYYTKLPKSLKRLAFRSALTLKEEDGQVRVIDDFDLSAPSTKSFQSIIDACGLNGKKVLFVTPESAPVLFKSCRNIPAVKMVPADTLCTYDVIAADTVLFTRQALDRLAQTQVQVQGEVNAE
jgi:large subunit ribosomal protein L4